MGPFDVAALLSVCVALRKLGVASLVSWLVLASGSGHAQVQAVAVQVDLIPLPQRSVIAPAVDCGTLTGRDFSTVSEGPARVQSAAIEPAQPDRAEFCVVKGYVAPTIQFELRLPTKTWTGRYLQGGCGGNCGVIMSNVAPRCDTPLAYAGAFAVGFENSGHTGTDGVWALGGNDVRENFAFRAAHAFAAAAKAVMAAYYGRPPSFSYFQGCSDGGREAMVETQRYPADFNGVIAGSPAFAIAEAMERFIWEARWGRDAKGALVFDAVAASLLHGAVIAACDALDGATDGQIDDPRRCHFDPARLQCPSGRSPPECLTETQVAVARRFYAGPTDEAGRHLFYGGEPYGSELTWVERYALPVMGATMFEDGVKNMMFQRSLGADVSVATWRFDAATFRALQQAGALYDARGVDLGAFRDAGGKLILWQGFADPAAGPYGLPDYYQRLGEAAGGLAAERRFARLFMIPGVYHCAGGYIPYEEDLLGAVVNWVEMGSAPDRVVSSARLPQGAIRRRPVYAYPVVARYRGRGDVNDAENFIGRDPAGPRDDRYDWAGASP
jgi:feruloyl esterase